MPVILGGNTGIYLGALVPPTPPPPVVTSGLILNLDAGNSTSYPGTGTSWFDLTANNYTHTINNAVYNSANGGSIRFDGSGDWVQKSYAPGDKYDLSITKKMTLDIWIKWDQLVRSLDGGIAFGGVFGNNTAGHTQWQFFKHISGSNTWWRFTVVNTTTIYALDWIVGNPAFTPPAPVAANTWVNMLFTYNWNTPTIVGYINGINSGGAFVGSNPASFGLPISGWQFSSIGASAPLGGSYSMLGNIGLIRIYDRDLTSTEALQNFNASRTRFGI